MESVTFWLFIDDSRRSPALAVSSNAVIKSAMISAAPLSFFRSFLLTTFSLFITFLILPQLNKSFRKRPTAKKKLVLMQHIIRIPQVYLRCELNRRVRSVGFAGHRVK